MARTGMSCRSAQERLPRYQTLAPDLIEKAWAAMHFCEALAAKRSGSERMHVFEYPECSI